MIHVATKFQKVPDGSLVVDTTSSSGQWRGLSPFILVGGRLYDDNYAKNVENAWQYSKVYEIHTDADGNPTQSYWDWATEGWKNPRGVRYPMGKGAVPLYSLWKEERLGYIEARKRIYIPLYARAVGRSKTFKELQTYCQNVPGDTSLFLRDYDGYDHIAAGETIEYCIHNPKKKLGHAFVLWMLLTNYVGPSFDATKWKNIA